MNRSLAPATALLVLCAGAALAWRPLTPVANLLDRAKSPADLRAQLVAHRDSVAATDDLDAAEAWFWLGVSHDRSNERTAAITALRRAYAVRRGGEDALALADALVRGSREEAAEAVALLEPFRARVAEDRSARGAAVRLRAAWATACAGDPGAAAAAIVSRPEDLLAPLEPTPRAATWACRFAPLLLSHGPRAQATTLLERALSASRGRDTSLVAWARRLAPQLAPVALAHAADSALARSATESPLVRFSVRADDGASLGAWSWRARPGAPLALVVLSPDAETFADADSVLAQLHRAGIAVAIVDPRGSRSSATSAAPCPGAWDGHEEAFARRTGRDIGAAISPALRATAADPARVCVIVEGSLAVVGALAAQGDRRVRSLVLVGASPSGAERGWLVATLADARVPTCFLTAPEDVAGNEVIDRIAMRVPPRQVRVLDSQSPGRGVALFRFDPNTARRLNAWLASEWTSRPSTPRARRR